MKMDVLWMIMFLNLCFPNKVKMVMMTYMRNLKRILIKNGHLYNINPTHLLYRNGEITSSQEGLLNS